MQKRFVESFCSASGNQDAQKVEIYEEHLFQHSFRYMAVVDNLYSLSTGLWVRPLRCSFGFVTQYAFITYNPCSFFESSMKTKFRDDYREKLRVPSSGLKSLATVKNAQVVSDL